MTISMQSRQAHCLVSRLTCAASGCAAYCAPAGLERGQITRPVHHERTHCRTRPRTDPRRSQGPYLHPGCHVHRLEAVGLPVHPPCALDDIEETSSCRSAKCCTSCFARGHDFSQILLGLNLTDPHDERNCLLPTHVPICWRWAFIWADAAAGPLALRDRLATGARSPLSSTCRGQAARQCLPSCGGVGAHTPRRRFGHSDSLSTRGIG